MTGVSPTPSLEHPSRETPPLESPPLEKMSPPLVLLYQYWQSKHRADGGLPRRADIDPVEIARARPTLMPHLWLADVLRDPYRFRYRLLGGALSDAGAPGRVGELVHDPALQDSGRAIGKNLHDNLVNLCEARCWNYRCGPPTLPHSQHIEAIERLSLPLVDDAGDVVVVLSASVYTWQEGWRPGLG